ncbi:Uncharacterised protein [Mycobacteroides abscessus subsp. abscessus]|nr:Uncharacterised protein [Mycobacteroides abscessus subsp. abscessus]
MPEDSGIDVGEDFFGRVARSAISSCVHVIRCGQGTSVQLAAHGKRQRVDHHHRGRHHIAREPRRELRPDSVRICLPNDVSDETQGSTLVLVSDHHCLSHSIERCQRRLDLTEFDSVSANLDLLIGATQIPQLPTVIPLHQVPGAIHTGAGLTEGAGHEARRCQPGPAPIAQAHTATRHVQLSGHTRRGRTHPLVQYEQSHSRHRGADQYRTPALQWCAYRCIHRGLRRPVGVDHHPPGRPAVHQFGWASLSRHHQRRRFQSLRRDHPGCRRCLTQYADALRDKQLMKFPGRCRHLFRHHQQARAV